jgi:hypothetical protein
MENKLTFPDLCKAKKLATGSNRLFIGAYGFEDRSIAWNLMQSSEVSKPIVTSALLIKYNSPKGKNKIQELKRLLKLNGVSNSIFEIPYDLYENEDIESVIESAISTHAKGYDEVVLDLSALTKFLVLIILDKLSKYNIKVRIVYAEALDYAPIYSDYLKAKNKISSVIRFPSRGFGTILRSRSLSSIRMQGQPVTLVAFTSFNEQLVRHMLGTISPHKLIFINGSPPHKGFFWRENATLEMHRKLIEEFPEENEYIKGRLKRTISTLNYHETIDCIKEIRKIYGLQERIIIAVTGSKMQTVGVFFAKKMFEDLHLEYPTPDSYYISGYSTGIKEVHEIVIEDFKSYFITLNHIGESLFF